MLSLTYVSTAESPFGPEEIADLLRFSRATNSRAGLTGMLLYKNGRFMQVLEGEESAVREAYGRIAADPRHSGLRILLDDTIEERRFPSWTMGFPVADDDELRSIEGFDAIFELAAGRRSAWDDPSRAQLLLDWFRRSV